MSIRNYKYKTRDRYLCDNCKKVAFDFCVFGESLCSKCKKETYGNMKIADFYLPLSETLNKVKTICTAALSHNI